MSPHRAFGRAAVLAAAVVLITASSCDDRWSSNPADPSLQPAFGARVTDGQLRLWTGSPCTDVDKVIISFDFYETVLELTASPPGGTNVDHLTLGGPYPGFTVTKPLPAGFDWRNSKMLTLQVKGHPDGLGSSSDVSAIITGSAEHAADTYWFQGVGWLDAADVEKQDAKTFLATCTPDPERK